MNFMQKCNCLFWLDLREIKKNLANAVNLSDLFNIKNLNVENYFENNKT